MKKLSGLPVAVVLLSAAVGSAMVGRAETPVPAGQQDAGQQQKQAAETRATADAQMLDLAVVRRDDEPGEGQEAQQKVVLELVAADAQVVKGKPYSADTSTETVQTMLDGNRIVHRTVSKFFRDSEGRTRREETFGNVDPGNPGPHEVKVFIDDPVNGTAFVLDPGSKSADKMQRSRKLLDERSADEDGVRMMFKSDLDAAEQGAPGRMLIKFRDDHAGKPDTMVIEDDRRNVAKEDLGTRSIEGVDCTGTRLTTTIPAGAIGNEKPIAIVTETWFAPVIGAVVQSTSDDPRFGKTTYQLTNLQLNEPQRTLFEPPADFKISPRK